MSTVWGKEAGQATGRGFAGVDPDGFLAKFKAWVVKAPVDHGPGWFLHDDQSALGTDPYIVVCDVDAPAVNSMNNGPSGLPPKFMRIWMKSTEVGCIRVENFLWWNKSTHTGYGYWGGYYVYTYDSATFEYRFRGGYCGIVIHSRRASSWSHAGVLDWEGDSNLVEGTDKYGVLQSGITAGSSVVLQLAAGQAINFTVNKWYFIFNFDGQHWVNYCKVIARDTGADTVTVDYLQKNFQSGSVIASYAHRFHQFGNGVSGDINSGNNTAWINDNRGKSTIPYVSSNSYYTSYGNGSYAFFNPSHYYLSVSSGVRLAAIRDVLERLNNDDYGLQAVMRPIIVEYYRGQDSSYNTYNLGMNRAYGQTKELYFCYNNAFSTGADGKIINGKNYVKFGTVDEISYNDLGNNYAYLFLETESTT